MSVWCRCSRHLLALTHVGWMAMACNFRRFRRFILPRTRYWSAIWDILPMSMRVDWSYSSPVLSCALVPQHSYPPYNTKNNGENWIADTDWLLSNMMRRCWATNKLLPSALLELALRVRTTYNIITIYASVLWSSSSLILSVSVGETYSALVRDSGSAAANP